MHEKLFESEECNALHVFDNVHRLAPHIEYKLHESRTIPNKNRIFEWKLVSWDSMECNYSFPEPRHQCQPPVSSERLKEKCIWMIGVLMGMFVAHKSLPGLFWPKGKLSVIGKQNWQQTMAYSGKLAKILTIHQFEKSKLIIAELVFSKIFEKVG